jgi:hypothetical protein
MYNWSTDTTRLKKNSEAYTKWKLTQQINFGTQGKRLNAVLLKKYLKDLVIDEGKRAFLTHILYA